MPEDFDVKQRTENIYKRWRSESMKKISDKHSNEYGETLERFYNRMRMRKGAKYLMIQKKKMTSPEINRTFSIAFV